MSLVADERIKLTASLFDANAAASIFAGGISPLVAILYGFVGTSLGAVTLTIAVIGGIVVGVGLHLTARPLLRRLVP